MKLTGKYRWALNRMVNGYFVRPFPDKHPLLFSLRKRGIYAKSSNGSWRKIGEFDEFRRKYSDKDFIVVNKDGLPLPQNRLSLGTRGADKDLKLKR